MSSINGNCDCDFLCLAWRMRLWKSEDLVTCRVWNLPDFTNKVDLPGIHIMWSIIGHSNDSVGVLFCFVSNCNGMPLGCFLAGQLNDQISI